MGDPTLSTRTRAPLTFERTEEVEKGVIGDLLGNGSDGAAALVLLLFLDCFDCDVFPFLPVNGAPAGTGRPSRCARQEKRPSLTQAAGTPRPNLDVW